MRTNLHAHDPAQLWTFYVQLTEVEQAFKELKRDLSACRRSYVDLKQSLLVIPADVYKSDHVQTIDMYSMYSLVQRGALRCFSVNDGAVNLRVLHDRELSNS